MQLWKSGFKNILIIIVMELRMVVEHGHRNASGIGLGDIGYLSRKIF